MGRKKSTRVSAAKQRASEKIRISDDILSLVKEQEGDQSPSDVHGMLTRRKQCLIINL